MRSPLFETLFEHWLSRPGRQLWQFLPAFTQAHLLQRPDLLHLQQTGFDFDGGHRIESLATTGRFGAGRFLLSVNGLPFTASSFCSSGAAAVASFLLFFSAVGLDSVSDVAGASPFAPVASLAVKGMSPLVVDPLGLEAPIWAHACPSGSLLVCVRERFSSGERSSIHST